MLSTNQKESNAFKDLTLLKLQQSVSFQLQAPTYCCLCFWMYDMFDHSKLKNEDWRYLFLIKINNKHLILSVVSNRPF